MPGTEADTTAPGGRRPHLRVGWLELFFDLTFVVLIQRIAHLLHGDPSVRRLLAVGALTMVVWVVWFNVTAVTNVSRGVQTLGRVLVFISMAGVGVMAVGIEGLPHGDAWTFLIGYSVARAVMWPLWVLNRRRLGRGSLRPLVDGPLLGLAWLATGGLAPPALWWSWAGLTAAEILLVWFQPRRADYDVDAGHLIERGGLFVMLVLGESVLQIITTLEAGHGARQWIVGGLCFVLVCSLWWLVYDATISRMEETAETNRAPLISYIVSGQPVIVVGLVGVAAGVANAIEHAGTRLTDGGLTALCGGVILVFLGISMLSMQVWTNLVGPVAMTNLGRLLRAATIAVPVTLVGLFGRHQEPILVVGLLVVLVVDAIRRQQVSERRLAEFVAAGGDPAAWLAGGRPGRRR